MAAPKQSNAISPDTPITIKITVNDAVKKLKLPLKDLGITVLPAKLRSVLDIKPEQQMTLERYSDSVGGYITLDESNPQVFKTLIRAAKAKLKLRLKATVTPTEHNAPEEKLSVDPAMAQTFGNYMSPRDVLDPNRRSVPSGIFQFIEARASQQTLINEDAPVPRPFFTAAPVPAATVPEPKHELAFRSREPAEPMTNLHAWSVYCNACDSPMLNAHYHCSICDDGDYDLCEKCVSAGKMCPGEDHWLIKRTIAGGKVINATTERLLSTKKDKEARSVAAPEPVVPKAGPAPFTGSASVGPASAKATLEGAPATPTRTCNSCVIVLPENEFITCNDCDDYDLCIKCHTEDKHGHHPAHGFKRATEQTFLPLAAHTKLAPGRNIRHNAICDGCEKKIYGIRHKCLSCPDWDYCNDCIKTAQAFHPQHRFAPLYQPIVDQVSCIVRHYGIYCDGPLCKSRPGQSYIQGVRYKCTICHDVDFCASCEALPGNHHNRTHPLLKLKTPVRNVNISTENSDPSGKVRVLGDRRPEAATGSHSPSTEAVPVLPTNAATQVQTVAEIKPTEVKPVESTVSVVKPVVPHSVEVIKEASAPIQIPVKKFVEKAVPAPEVQTNQLNAHFVHDVIPDGYVCEPETRFTQVWTLKNPGPFAWPPGCSVRYVGGDDMLNVDNSHPASVRDLAQAAESNVVARAVEVGEEIAFKITLKAPKREGKSISYWRLKAADGTPFGHRLWCDIEVKKAEAEQSSFMGWFKQPEFSPSRSTVAAPSVIPTGMFMPHMPAFASPPQVELQALRQQASQLATNGSSTPKPHYEPYDSANLAARLDKMREAQKQRREQMLSLLQAQREKTAMLSPKYESPGAYQHMVAKAVADADEQRDAVKQRVAQIKASILETRAERDRLHRSWEAANATKSQEDEEKVKKIVEEANKTADEDTKEEEREIAAEVEEEKLEGSQMVFPRLEKESPSSSTYQSVTSSISHGKAAYVENDEGEIEQTATHVDDDSIHPDPSVASTVVDDEEDFESVDNEIEVLSATGEESEDDGFLTDEEYDILDASDDETVASTK